MSDTFVPLDDDFVEDDEIVTSNSPDLPVVEIKEEPTNFVPLSDDFDEVDEDTTVETQTEEIVKPEQKEIKATPFVPEDDDFEEDDESTEIEAVADVYELDEVEDEPLDLEDLENLGKVETEYDPRIAAKYDEAVGKIDVDRILSDTEEEVRPQIEQILEQTFYQEQIEERLNKTSGENVTGMLPRRSTELETLEALGITRTEIQLRDAEEDRDNIHELLNDANTTRAASVNALLDTGLSLDTIGWIVQGGEFVPFYGGYLALTDVPINLEIAKELWAEGEWVGAAAVAGASTIDIALGIAGVLSAGKLVTKRVKNRRDRYTKIREATEQKRTAKVEAAAKVVKDNRKFTNKMIKEYEMSIDPTGKTKVSKKDSKGNLVLDYEAARQVGLGITEDMYNAQQKYMDRFMEAYRAKDQKAIADLERESGVSVNQMLAMAEENADGFVSPLLRADSFDSMVAVAIDLKQKYPDAFNNNKTVIDNLFELSVSNKFDADELNDVLSKYGLSFNEYVLGVVGSGSEAGRTLQKLSRIKKAGTFKLDDVQTRELERTQSGIVSAWRRIENIRRGSMTSMFKTAVRNFQSGVIRSPMEAIENVFDTVLLEMSREFNSKSDRMLLTKSLRAAMKGGQTFVSPSQWAGSLAMLKRIYATPYASKQLTEIMLDNPKFADNFKALQNNVNEYRKATGAGKGGVADGVLSGAESVVDVLQIPNRIQEFVIRRGVFTGEMERLLKRDWGIDLVKEMEAGNWEDIMTNASKFRPKGARSIDDIVDEATKRALDVTYAKAPDVPQFKRISDFLTSTGLTAVTTPFPRFMFNSIELLGQYSGGAFNPAIKRILGKKTGPLDAKDRQNISRNISGLAAIYAAYQYRTSGGAPADYKQMEGIDNITGEETVIDVTAQFPMRQVLWIAEAMKRLDPSVQKKLPVSGPLNALGLIEEGEGTFDDWFDPKEALEVFMGVNARTGASNVFIDEISDILAGGGEDLVSLQKQKARLGRLVGDYLRTHLIPATQIVEIQRMVGVRPTEYVDYSSDNPDTFSGNVRRSLDQAGITTLFNPSSEEELPSREFVLSEDRKRIGTKLGLMAGITVLQKNNPDAEYLINKGFSEFELGSREKGSIRREENAAMREYLPDIVDAARIAEEEARESYKDESKFYKENYTIEEHVNATVIADIGKMVRETRKAVSEFKLVDAPLHAVEYRKFKRMSPAARKYALSEFMSENDRFPSLVDEDDVIDLLLYAKEKQPK